MNVKRFAAACVAVYVVHQVCEFLVHVVWLGGTYKDLAHVWRPEDELMSLYWVMYVSNIFYAVVFCFIFVRGYENRGIAEGVRYGALVGLLMSIPMAFASYSIYPIPFSLAVKWLLSGIAIAIVEGIVVASIYRPKPAGAVETAA